MSIDLEYPLDYDILKTENIINTFIFCLNEEYLVLGDDKGYIQFLNYDHKTVLKNIQADISPITSFCYNITDKHCLYSGSESGLIKKWLIESYEQLYEYVGHTATVNKIIPIHQQEKIISCSNDGTVRLWSTASGKCIRIFDTYNHSPVKSIKLDFKNKYLGAVCQDGYIHIWDIETYDYIFSQKLVHTNVLEFFFLDYTNEILFYDVNKKLTVFDFLKNTVLKTSDFNYDITLPLISNISGKQLAFCSNNFSLVIVGLTENIVNNKHITYNEFYEKKYNNEESTDIISEEEKVEDNTEQEHHHYVISPAEIESLLDVSKSNEPKLRNEIKSGLYVFGLFQITNSVSISSDGQFIVSSNKEKINIFEAESLKRLKTINLKKIKKVIFIPETHKFIANSDENIYVYNVDIWYYYEIPTNNPYPNPIKYLSISKDKNIVYIFTNIQTFCLNILTDKLTRQTIKKVIISGLKIYSNSNKKYIIALGYYSNDKNALLLKNKESGVCLLKIPVDKLAKDICLSEDGLTAAVSFSDRKICIYSMKPKKILHTFYTYEDISVISFYQNTNYFIAGDVNGKIYLWDLNKSELITAVYLNISNENDITNYRKIRFELKNCDYSHSLLESIRDIFISDNIVVIAFSRGVVVYEIIL